MSNKDLWKWLWNISAIPKAKLLVWRCVEQALPTNSGLRRRGMDVDAICSRCGEEEETVEHVFRKCPWTVFFWMASPLRIRSENSDQRTLVEWIKSVCLVDSKEYHTLFVTLLWTIWFAWNLLVFQNKELSHAHCFEMALKNIPTPYAGCRRGEKRKPVTTRKTQGFWRIQRDAAVKNDHGVGYGIVIVDNQDHIISCRYGFYRVNIKVELAECMAVREGLNLAKELQAQQIIVETDSQGIHSKITNNGLDFSYIGHTIEDIHQFNWIDRNSNSLADQLAKFARNNCIEGHITGSLPFSVSIPPSWGD